MKTTAIEIQPLDQNRYALYVDGLVRYVGTVGECERRAAIHAPKMTAPLRTAR